MKIIYNSEDTTQFKVGDIVSAYYKRDGCLIKGFNRLEIIDMRPCIFKDLNCRQGNACLSDSMLYMFRDHNISYCGGYLEANWEYRKGG